MNITKKLISLLLAVLMLCGTLTCFSITVSAAEADSTTETGTGEAEEDKIDYLNQIFATPEEKLATMKLMTAKGNYEIYADAASGEVAVKDIVSGQILFTNPYDIGALPKTVDSVKNTLMSQIVVHYTENGKPKEYYSYEHAAVRDQIKVKNIKNGIRVEYTIGREEARRLVPRMIEQSRFEEFIKNPVLEYYGGDEEDFYFGKFMAYYSFISLETLESDKLKAEYIARYPVLKDDMKIYVFDPSASVVELERQEEIIKAACTNYSYEEMDYDHNMTQYEGTEENPPVFKMALEYTLEEDGFAVRMPANGIRFNESKFQLESICVLPYMGAGNSTYEGYTFFPDGSGALFAFEDLVDVNSNSVSSKVYGNDYAYHEISGTYQQTVRYPVFGVVEKTRYYDFEKFDDKLGETTVTRVNGMIYDTIKAAKDSGTGAGAKYAQYTKLLDGESEATEEIVNRGFVAIIEEGDAMAEIAAMHEGVKHPYDSVQMSFVPRPQDTYNMAEAISVGTATDWTVVSSRKYVGNYKIRYVMLTDKNVAAEKGLKTGDWYDATWMGMAMAYRDYLVERGVLSALTETNDDIPLYIEAFGSVETVEKYLSIPVNVKKPLTSFEDVQTMYAELLAQGINNINFKLTGHANGGMYAKAAYNLKWEKSVSKDVSFQELLDFAKLINDGDYTAILAFVKDKELFKTEEELAAFEEHLKNVDDTNLGIYPEFDFSYVWSDEDTLFDGLSLRKHAARTIDDRSASKRVYVATRQKYMSYYQLAVSPAYFSHFYEKLMSKYLTYENVTGISVGTLGNTLNSDFDEDEPYNREDSKSFVKKALDFFSSEEKSNLNVMVDGGNAYTWQYVDHILGASIDSSRYIRASYSVPFIGVVLHGYTNFTGTPLNMEGDLNYAKLKAIENGAAVYFTLSYQNTQTLKEDELLSQYYSIRYDIWFDDVVEIYNELNREMKDLQTKPIVGHQFLSGMRVPDTDELYADIMADFNRVQDFQSNKAEYEEKQKNEAVADARDKIASSEAAAVKFIRDCLTYYSDTNNGAASKYTKDFEVRYAAFMEADEALKTVQAAYDSAATDEEKQTLTPVLEAAKKDRKAARASLVSSVRLVSSAVHNMEVAYKNLTQLLADAEEGALLINSTEKMPESIIAEIKQQLDAAKATMEITLGMKFDHTVEKAELDTFIYAHSTHLLLSCYGEVDNAKVGKQEKLFELLQAEEYGLMINEIELLRYLEANRNLSDEEIIAKYELAEGSSSVKGLMTYLEELLGDNYVFDPMITGDDSVVDGLNAKQRNILEYYRYVLYSRLMGLTDDSVLPKLNFKEKRINDKGNSVDNSTNNDAVKVSINTAYLTATYNVWKNIQDGNYDFDANISAAQLQKLIDECIGIIKAATPNSKTPVEYATPETMAADLENYIRAKYYKEALSKLIPSNEAVALRVIKVTSKTDATVSDLVAAMIQKYGKGEGTGYAELWAQFTNDAYANQVIAKIADSVKASYGDVSDVLYTSYLKQIAAAILGAKAPTLTLDLTVELTAEEKAEVQTAVDNALAAAIAESKDVDEAIADVADAWNTALEAVVASRETEAETAETAQEADSAQDAETEEVTVAEDDTVVEEETLSEEEQAETQRSREISDYVYYAYLQLARDAKVNDAFFYDGDLSRVDVAVRTDAGALYDVLVEALADGASVYDVYNAALSALTDEDRNVKGFVAGLAASIPYAVDESDGKSYSLATDLLNYYVYFLLDNFDEKLPASAPAFTALKSGLSNNLKNSATKQVKKNADEAVKELISAIKLNTKRGALPNYALSSAMTADELAAWADAEVTKLIDAKYALEENREALRAEVMEFFQYTYYTAVMGELSVATTPVIHVAEVYGDDIYTAAQDYKRLLRYYVTQLSQAMTEEEIDHLINRGGSQDKDDEDQQEAANKYVSDDGRIVAVTYGTPDVDGSYDAYKTFILNYNNFSVSVVYEGITYTIPAYGYVTIGY